MEREIKVTWCGEPQVFVVGTGPLKMTIEPNSENEEVLWGTWKE